MVIRGRAVSAYPSSIYLGRVAAPTNAANVDPKGARAGRRWRERPKSHDLDGTYAWRRVATATSPVALTGLGASEIVYRGCPTSLMTPRHWRSGASDRSCAAS